MGRGFERLRTLCQILKARVNDRARDCCEENPPIILKHCAWRSKLPLLSLTCGLAQNFISLFATTRLGLPDRRFVGLLALKVGCLLQA